MNGAVRVGLQWIGALLLFANLLSVPAWAQESTEPAPLPTADAQRLLDTLKDDARRDAFIADLEAMVAVQKARDEQVSKSAGTQLLETLSAKVGTVGTELVSLTETIVDIPRLLSAAVTYFADASVRSAWLSGAMKLIVVLLAGWLAKTLVKRVLKRFHRSIESQGSESFWLTMLLALLRAVLDLVAVAAFAGVAYAVMTVVAPAHGARVLAIALINASVIAQIVLIVAKLLVAPDVTVMRLLAMNDETANYILLWIRRLVYVTAYGYFLTQALSVLGAPGIVYGSIAKMLGLLVALMLLLLVMQNRADIAARIRGEATGFVGQLRRRTADIWHLVAMLYVVAIYGVWLLEVPGGFEYVFRASGLSVVALLLSVLLVGLMRRTLDKVFSLSEEHKARFPGLEARSSRYLPVLIGGLKFVIYAVAALTVLRIWGLDAFAWISTPLGSSMLKGMLNIVVMLLVALVIWEVVSTSIERYLSVADSEGNAVARGQRAMTLLPLLRNVVLVVLAVLVTLTVLSELGVNIGPIIAGAGILGLAIGFGAQTFVKDVITGFFILVEDAVAVGDIVILAGYKGKVEAISIRSIQLRDLQGDVHRIPFSEVTSTTNRSKIFSYAAFDIGVAYREDVDHCMDVIRDLGAEFRRDEVFGEMILEDIDIMGVQSFDDSAVIIRARIKVQPGKQLGVVRAFNRLLKNRFDAEGIEIPFPHRTIYFGVDKEGAAPPAYVQVDDARSGSRPPSPTSADAADDQAAGDDERSAPK